MDINKKILLLVALVFIASVGIVVAQDTTIDDYTFTIPDGYEVKEVNGSMITLMEGDEHAIVVMITDDVKDSEDAKENLESQGYKFIGEDTYSVGSKEVRQQNYEKNDYTVMTYVFSVGDDQCIITFTIPSSETAPEGADNPVSTIINSIK
ncbi:hypothetical protein [Methanobrevibacter sp.]|uniref:hypothetical protein n=1 Tax=Methanobrevibacter sp. TaxID=66852 RepID=UPI0025CBAAB4|nr:hypothetical protein [Methanobrevibacter sp.]MBQ2831671.1 hypothetical protein [Methanobrevibacter sp.]